MAPRSLLPLLALAGCTPVDRFDGRGRALSAPVLGTLSAQVREQATWFRWIEAPLAPGLEPAHQARAGRLRVYLSPAGLHLLERAPAAGAAPWVVDLALVGFGRDGAVRPVPRGTSWAEGASFESARGDGLVEYAEHTEEGLEHGFRLRRRPAGDGPVVLELSVAGAVPHATDDGAVLVVPGRATIGWRGLRVTDATGRGLPAVSEAADRVLRVHVDDRGAAWPVTVDPILATEEATIQPLFGPSGAQNHAGFSLDADGDRILVGNPGPPTGTSQLGRAAVFDHDQGGLDEWGLTRELDSGTADQREGYAVALEEDLAAVASPQAGKVYLYQPIGGTWTANGTATGGTGEGFGQAIDLFGDGLVVGAPNYAIGSGRIYVFNRFDADWTAAQPDALVSGGGAGDRFGSAVSADADHVLVGAPGGDYARLFVVEGRGGGGDTDTVSLVADLRFEVPGSEFGAAVSLHGELAAVGAPGAERVRVFHRISRDSPVGTTTPQSAESWNDLWDLLPPLEASPGFGTDVEVSSDTVAVTDGGDPVRVHLFEWTGTGFLHTQSLEAGAAASGLPVAITLTDTLLAAGVPSDGSVRIWRRTGDRWLPEVHAGAVAGDALGDAVAVDGDLIAVGAPRSDLGGVDGGEVFFFERTGEGEFTSVGSQFGAAGEQLGSAVDVAEDLVVVGAPHADTGATESGRVSLSTWDGAEVWPLRDLAPVSPTANLHYGDTVACDGLKVLVGQPGWNAQTGSAHLYGRHVGGHNAFGFLPDATPVLQGAVSGNRSGSSAVAVSGGWIAAGSGLWDGPLGTNQGRVLLQNFDGTTLLPRTELLGSAAGERFGAALSLEGTALAVGAPRASASAGRVDVYRLAPGGWAVEASVGGAPASELGSSVALLGDRLFAGAPAADEVDVRVRNQGGASQWGRLEVLAGAPSFGAALDADESLLAVGAPAANADAGEVTLLERDANVPPRCRDEAAVLSEDEAVALDVADEEDANGDVLVYTVVDPPDHARAGAFTLRNDGSLDYRGAPDWFGADAVGYEASDGTFTCAGTLSLQVEEVNDAPVAGADGPYAATEDAPLHVDAVAGLLANDVDPDTASGVPETLVAVISSGPDHGSVTVSPDGSFDYVPDPDWFGTDTFTYVARDDDSSVDDSAPTAVTLVVAPLNDPPTLVQADQTFTGLVEDTPFQSPPPGLLSAASDKDGDALVVTVQAPPQHGFLQLGDNGFWVYTPDPDTSGDDTFTCFVGDASSTVGPVTVHLTVDPVNDAPVSLPDGPFVGREDDELRISIAALLRNDADPEGSALSIVLDTPPTNDGTVTVDPLRNDVLFVPTAQWSGTTSFTYRSEDADGAASAAVAVTLVIEARNDLPVAEADPGGDTVGTTPLSGNVLTNDTDADGDALEAVVVLPPIGGELTLEPDGDWTYVARAGFAGADGFLYAARDAAGATSASARVTLLVLQDAPGPETAHTGLPEGCDDPTPWFVDVDGDGFGDPEARLDACAAPDRFVADATDCDDLASDVFPGAPERSGDGRDQDCDGRDNVVQAVGACDHTGPRAWAPGAALVLLARRRRRP